MDLGTRRAEQRYDRNSAVLVPAAEPQADPLGLEGQPGYETDPDACERYDGKLEKYFGIMRWHGEPLEQGCGA